MLGKTVGSLQNIPAPSAATLNEALKLLSTFGDSKSISKLLEQVKEVQANNEQVLRDAQSAIAKLKTDAEALVNAQAKFSTTSMIRDSNAGIREQKLSQAEARLSGNIAKFNQEQSAAKATLAEAEESLSMAEQAVSQRESVCASREQDIARRQTAIEKKEDELSAYANQIQAKEKKLRAALDGG